MDNRTALIWLSGIQALSVKSIERLMQEYGEPGEIWEAAARRIPCLTARQNEAVRAVRSEEYLDRLLGELEEKSLYALTLMDEEYPASLRCIEEAPPVLFLRGENLLEQERMAAVVGTRRCSTDGRMTAERLGRELAEGDVCVVSGMAGGIDDCAHRGCLQAGGRTVAVLGCAADVCYPPENRDLMEQILESGGCVVYEHAPGMSTKPYHFAYRNRIISGLSRAVVVVEAGEKSGALVTAEYARQQRKFCFAVPGSIYSHSCRGSNLLLTQHARALLSAEQLLSACGWPVKQKQAVQKQEPELDPQSREIVEFLKNEEKTFDEIANHLKIETWMLNSLLTILEMQGIIRQSAGKLYRLVI